MCAQKVKVQHLCKNGQSAQLYVHKWKSVQPSTHKWWSALLYMHENGNGFRYVCINNKSTQLCVHKWSCSAMHEQIGLNGICYVKCC